MAKIEYAKINLNKQINFGGYIMVNFSIFLNKIKHRFKDNRYDSSINLLKSGLKMMLEFEKGYTKENVNRSQNRVLPVEMAVASILKLYGKRDIIVDNRRSLRFVYNGNDYGDILARTTYIPDILYRDDSTPNLVSKAIEVRCSRSNLFKNKQNNTTNLLGRMLIFNKLMEAKASNSSNSYFSVIGFLERIAKDRLFKLIEEYLVLRDFNVITALVIYDANPLIIYDNLVPEELSLHKFLMEI